MKDHTQFSSSSQFALAIIGEPFTRKTSLAFQFPKPLFFDCDRKLSSVVDHYPAARPFWWVEPDLDEKGNEWPPHMKWVKFLDCIDKHAKAEGPLFWVFDSMTRVAEFLMDHVIEQGAPGKPLIIGGEKVMTQQMWYPFYNLFSRFVVKVRTLGHPCIFIFHEKTSRDENTGTVTKQPAISGQFADNGLKLFSESWRTFVKQVSIDIAHPGGIAYYVRTEPIPLLQQLGHSKPLLPEFEQSQALSLITTAYPNLFKS